VKIALLSHLASRDAPTGAERSLGLLADGLSQRGHVVAVAAPGPWVIGAQLRADGIGVSSIPVRSCWLVQYRSQALWRQMLRAARYAAPDSGLRKLRKWLAELDPDVVHVNCLPHLRGAAAARVLGLPVVWHVREILPSGVRRRWFARRLRSRATRIVAVSDAVAAWLREEGLGELVEVVHNGVDPPTAVADRRSAQRRFGVPSDGLVFGLFSQLVEHKGASDFVRAAHRAVEGNPTLAFLIAGHGPAEFTRRLRHEIADGAAAGRIRLVPPQGEIWDLLAAVDVVALTTQWPDPLPRVVMEAMSFGLPVLSYADGGVPEMVSDGKTGLLSRPGDVDGLAQGMLKLAGDEGLRRQFGEAGRLRSRQLFSVARHVDRMEAVFESVVRSTEG
jgi:glycosyltransferase involved in cell wall biosynthesis